jgi:hypothetical protein
MIRILGFREGRIASLKASRSTQRASGVIGIPFQLGGAIPRNPLQIAALVKCIERVRPESFVRAPLENRRTNVRSASILKAGFRSDQICPRGAVLSFSRSTSAAFAKKLLRDDRRLDHRFDLAFKVVTLIDRITDVRGGSGFPLEEAISWKIRKTWYGSIEPSVRSSSAYA